MTTPELLFWTMCIPSRVALSTLPLMLPDHALRPFGYLLAGVSATFLVLRVLNLRLDAREGGANGTWWHNWRPVHGIMYALAAFALIEGNRDAWKILAADVAIAVFARAISKPSNF